jgi:hypothetical protein
MNADREFLFSYRFGGAEWGVAIHASGPAEAMEKIKSVALARYSGEVSLRIPMTPAGLWQAFRALFWTPDKAELARLRHDLATFGRDTVATENRIIDAEFAVHELRQVAARFVDCQTAENEDALRAVLKQPSVGTEK